MSITSKTNEEITNEILECIGQLPVDVGSVMADNYKRNVKGKKKEILVEFYNHLLEEMDEEPEVQVDDNDIPDLEYENN